VALLGKKDRADDGDSAASAKNVSNRLRTLEERGFTGAVEISVKGSNATAQIYFYEGGVYATHLGGYGPVVMDRLRTDGVVDASRWSELAQIFGAHQAHGRVGPTAVEQEWMTVDELVNLHQELLIACLGAVIAVPKARIDRETSATTSDYCSLPQDIPRLLRLVQGRQQRIARAWEAIEARCEPGELVLRRGSAAMPSNLDRDEFRALLELVDGVRSADEIAHALGLTRADVIRAASLLVLAGTVEVDHDRRATPPRDRLLVPEAWGGWLDERAAPTPAEPVAWPAEPAWQPAPEPEPEAAWQPEPEPEPEPAWQPEPEPEPAWQPEPEPEPEPAWQPEPEPEPEPAWQPEPQPEPVWQPEPEPEPAPETQPEPEPAWQPSRRHALQEATARALQLEQQLSESIAAEQEALARSAVIRQRLRETLAEVASLSAHLADGHSTAERGGALPDHEGVL
jgi:outer membrane biosynthesis protein TonB